MLLHVHYKQQTGKTPVTLIKASAKRNIVALDADGVLLDYNLAYAHAWEKAFGYFPWEKDPNAYWAMDRWGVTRLTGGALERFRLVFDEEFWSSVPAMGGAIAACDQLVHAGYRLVCVTALPERFQRARAENLKSLGFPVEEVYSVEHSSGPISPKAGVLLDLNPVAFVDDYLPYMLGVPSHIHRALILRGTNGSPNKGADGHVAISSTHGSLMDFSNQWCRSRPAFRDT